MAALSDLLNPESRHQSPKLVSTKKEADHDSVITPQIATAESDAVNDKAAINSEAPANMDTPNAQETSINHLRSNNPGDETESDDNPQRTAGHSRESTVSMTQAGEEEMVDIVSIDEPKRKKKDHKGTKRARSGRPKKERKKRKKDEDVDDDEHGEDEAAAEDAQVYCICQVTYTDERFMIACDGCDNWFHGQCVGISEDDAQLLDRWFCPDCANDGSKEGEIRISVWKEQCADEECKKAARGSSVKFGSKYCSNECAIKSAQRKLSTMSKERRITITSILTSGRLTKLAMRRLQGSLDSLAEPVPADVADEKDLKNIESQRSTITAAIDALRQRRVFLDAVVERAEQWEWREEETKAKSGSGSEPCGMDDRLAWDPDRWNAYLNGQVIGLEEEGQSLKSQLELGVTNGLVGNSAHMCLRTRRQCDRHSGWHRTNAIDIDIQDELQAQTLEQLGRDEVVIKQRIKRRLYDLGAIANTTVDHVVEMKITQGEAAVAAAASASNIS